MKPTNVAEPFKPIHPYSATGPVLDKLKGMLSPEDAASAASGELRSLDHALATRRMFAEADVKASLTFAAAVQCYKCAPSPCAHFVACTLPYASVSFVHVCALATACGFRSERH